MGAFTRHRVAPLLYDVIRAAGDARDEAALAEAACAGVLAEPSRRAVGGQLSPDPLRPMLVALEKVGSRTCCSPAAEQGARRCCAVLSRDARGLGGDEAFFASRVVWDATVFARSRARRARRDEGRRHVPRAAAGRG